MGSVFTRDPCNGKEVSHQLAPIGVCIPDFNRLASDDEHLPSGSTSGRSVRPGKGRVKF